jgi:hypothetical protein
MLIDDFNEIQDLNVAITALLEALNGMDPTDDAYAKLADQLTKLTKIKQIIVDTKLKDFDAEEKAFQFRQSHELKDRELTQKSLETERTLALKQKELSDRVAADTEAHYLREREFEFKRTDAEKPDRVSKDALVAAATSVAGILIIVGYERFNVIASKALGFVVKR